MKKILLICVLFFNVIPIIKHGMITIEGPELILAQTQDTGVENGRDVDNPCDGIQSTYDNTFSPEGNIEHTGFLVADVNTGEQSFVSNPTDGNTDSTSHWGSIKALPDSPEYPGNDFVIVNGKVYEVLAEFHSHPHDGAPWDPGPSSEDFAQIDEINLYNNNIPGYVLSADGNVYKYGHDDNGVEYSDNLGSMSDFMDNMGC